MVGAKTTARFSTAGVPRHWMETHETGSGCGVSAPYLQWIDKRKELVPMKPKKPCPASKRNESKYLLEYDAVKEEIERQERELNERLGARDAREIFFALNDRGWLSIPGEDAFTKEFVFRSFDEAWSFMTQTVEEARLINRYPDWSHTYNTVTVNLPGSFCHGITLEDARLAKFMESVVDALTL